MTIICRWRRSWQRVPRWEMFDSLTQKDLRAQMEQHLLMVEEVLGGLDQFVQGLGLA